MCVCRIPINAYYLLFKNERLKSYYQIVVAEIYV